MAMDNYIKRRWVDALRSGLYKQGKRNLRTRDGGYSCLGVLDEVASGHVEIGKAWLRRKYGLSDSECATAAHWNDGAGLHFVEIAWLIEIGDLDGVPLRAD